MIKKINNLAKNEPEDQQNPVQSTSTKAFQDISTSIEYNNVYKIVLNRPAKFNAITIKATYPTR